MLTLLLAVLAAICSFGQADSRRMQTPVAEPSPYGTWKMNPALSKREGNGKWARSYTVRFEPHPAGERVTISRVTWDGKHVTEMYVLRLDGKDYPLLQSSRFDTTSARKLTDGTVEELVKKDGKVVFRGLRRFSSDGSHLIQEYHWMPPRAQTAILVLERENDVRK